MNQGMFEAPAPRQGHPLRTALLIIGLVVGCVLLLCGGSMGLVWMADRNVSRHPAVWRIENAGGRVWYQQQPGTQDDADESSAKNANNNSENFEPPYAPWGLDGMELSNEPWGPPIAVSLADCQIDD